MSPREWLKVLTRVAARVEEATAPLIGRTQTPLGEGAGGDETLPLDEAAESVTLEILEEVGDVRVVTEEAGVVTFGDPEAVVIVDPVDGSHNARVGLPAYAVSLAVAPLDGRLGDIVCGLVRNLATGQTYAAPADGGATLDGEPVRPSDATEGWTAGFELWPPRMVDDGFWPRATQVMKASRRIRSLGSTAIAGCLVAKGAVDVHVDVRGTGRVLDLTAVHRIMTDAGAVVTDDRGRPLEELPIDLDTTTTLVAAGNETLHAEILELLR